MLSGGKQLNSSKSLLFLATVSTVVPQQLLPRAATTRLGTVTRAGSRVPPWLGAGGIGTKLPSSAGGEDGEWRTWLPTDHLPWRGHADETVSVYSTFTSKSLVGAQGSSASPVSKSL